MSLSSPHKLFLAAGSKTYKVCKARIQMKFLCQQYPCGEKTRHWTPENPSGFCTFPSCYSHKVVESPEHILLHCSAYTNVRNNMISLCLKLKNSISHGIFMTILLTNPNQTRMQFLLDCSTIPEINANTQKYSEIW